MNWIKNLVTLEWWIGVVVVGVAINILSAYVLRLTPKIIGKFSQRLANRSEANLRRRKLHIEILTESSEMRVQSRFNITTRTMLGMVMLVVGFFAGLSSQLAWVNSHRYVGFLGLLTATLCFYQFVQSLIKCMMEWSELGEATKQVIHRELATKWPELGDASGAKDRLDQT